MSIGEVLLCAGLVIGFVSGVATAIAISRRE